LISIDKQLRPKIADRAIQRRIGKDKRQRDIIACRQRKVEGSRVESDSGFGDAGHGTACFPAA